MKKAKKQIVFRRVTYVRNPHTTHAENVNHELIFGSFINQLIGQHELPNGVIVEICPKDEKGILIHEMEYFIEIQITDFIEWLKNTSKIYSDGSMFIEIIDGFDDYKQEFLHVDFILDDCYLREEHLSPLVQEYIKTLPEYKGYEYILEHKIKINDLVPEL
jgi:hypothetical protein